MELIGWQREKEREREGGRKVGEKGNEGWKWKRMRGWDREAVREGKKKKVASEGGQVKTFPLYTGHTVLRGELVWFCG